MQTLRGLTGIPAGARTYRAFAGGYTAYATPTDLIRINGSATKTVAILNAALAIQQTAGALQIVHYIKRSAANTGGTSTQATLVALDSSSPAATATVDVYTAAPTLGTAVATISQTYNTAAATTAAPTNFGLYAGAMTLLGSVSAVSFHSPVILRGAAEGLSINWNGVALPAGFTAFYVVEIAEF